MFTEPAPRSTTHLVAARAAGIIAATAALGLALTPATASAANYKNGSFSGTGTYTLPVGTSDLGVQMALANNVVRSASVTYSALPISREFQTRWWNASRGKIVGKNIDQIHVGKTAGSSLTPNGFNGALAQIKSQARR
ncbi:hypothetical protein GOARA_011_00020 [Gordonia araii NBRC 100433]|uniref:Uncharacterized protein n=1 Tax=Gordonia araii NBRC 100433 TaxID=1073574 RepID=G7GXR1_9ACTN|nr:hypothetical protein [Gordonia araii]NNG98419.1 hypothetical protein [Gordonia araii NBRC 100433]GAB08386.1 hypothetical protein GOARA_011_00020 [Gordonia araii NBRC 100433]